jgi:hypothetical protein
MAVILAAIFILGDYFSIKSETNRDNYFHALENTTHTWQSRK